MAIVTTTKGDRDDSLLERKDVHFEDDNESTDAIEYWLDGELVHRSVHVTLKQNVLADGMAAMLG
jgi:hypothetical protein